MTRYLCPKCEDHPTLMENLDCYFCKGKYIWQDPEVCKCGHHTNDHSYDPKELLNDDLDCDKCDCKKFISCTKDVSGGKK